MDKGTLMIVKVLITVCILMMAFFNIRKPLRVIDNKAVKVMLLLGVVLVLYYDLNTGILLTIAFLMMMIQLNALTMEDIQLKKWEMFLATVPAEFGRDGIDDKVGVAETDVLYEKAQECGNKKNETTIQEHNSNSLDYAVDSKVKPYEVFVKMLTTKEQLDAAANSAFLQ